MKQKRYLRIFSLLALLLLLTSCENKGKNIYDRTSMIRYDSRIYIIEPDNIVDDYRFKKENLEYLGEITDAVPGTDIPEKNFTSNFIAKGASLYKSIFDSEMEFIVVEYDTDKSIFREETSYQEDYQ